MKILLVTPPLMQLNTPYPATTQLVGFLYGTIDYLYYTHGTLEWQARRSAEYYINHIY